MFFQFILAMLLGFACPNHSNATNNDGTTVTAQDTANTPRPIPGGPGGETGNNPPR